MMADYDGSESNPKKALIYIGILLGLAIILFCC